MWLVLHENERPGVNRFERLEKSEDEHTGTKYLRYRLHLMTKPIRHLVRYSRSVNRNHDRLPARTVLIEWSLIIWNNGHERVIDSWQVYAIRRDDPHDHSWIRCRPCVLCVHLWLTVITDIVYKPGHRSRVSDIVLLMRSLNDRNSFWFLKRFLECSLVSRVFKTDCSKKIFSEKNCNFLLVNANWLKKM